MLKLIFAGMKRRKKEIRYVSLVAFIAVVFMTGITLFQSAMNSYLFQNNLNTYGNWVVSSVNRVLLHPYLINESACTTGCGLVDEAGNDNGIMVGKTDDNFHLIKGEALYEGRMPESDDEIAMDIKALSLLGYNYELGQSITVYYRDANWVTQERNYRLVGILKNISDIWKTDMYYALPDLYVTEKEFEIFNINSYTTYFYQLNPEYEQIDTYEMAKSFDNNGMDVTYNQFVYQNGVCGSSEIFDYVTYALMLISVYAIGFLLLSYMGKRREIYYKYRCIGASKTQVRTIVSIECILATFPYILLGIICVYGVFFVMYYGATQTGIIPPFYKFEIKLCVKQLLVSIGVVLVSIFATQISISDKRLARNTGLIKPSKYEWLRKLASKTRCPEKTIFKRQNIIRPVQHIIGILFSIAVSGCLVFCGVKLEQSYIEMTSVIRNKDDVFLSAPRMEYMINHEETGHGGSVRNMYCGVDENILEEILLCPGVKTVAYSREDGLHYFKWDGMEESDAINFLKEDICCSPLEYGMNARYYENVSEIKAITEYIPDASGGKDIDWEAIERGEKVILIISNNLREKENTLDVGDTLYITHAMNETAYPVEVAAIYSIYIESTFDENYAILKDWFTSSYFVVGTTALANQIAQVDKEELKITGITVEYDTFSTYQSTDKQLSNLAGRYGMSYGGEAEIKRIYIQQFTTDVGIYGTMFCMILIVYIIIQRSFLRSKNQYWKNRFTLLKQIGMEDNKYMWLSFQAECKSYLSLFWGLLYFYATWKEPYNGLMCVVVIVVYCIMIISSGIVIRKSVQGGNLR